MAINSLSTGWRPGVCTSSTRPTAPYEGQIIYETDTGQMSVWSGSVWNPINPNANRNLIFNGNFDIWQRGTSFSTDNAATAIYTADRWCARALYPNSSAVQTITQESTNIPAGSKFSLKSVIATAAVVNNSRMQLCYTVEPADAIRYAGKQMMLSMQIKAIQNINQVAVIPTYSTTGGKSFDGTAISTNYFTVTTSGFTTCTVSFTLPSAATLTTSGTIGFYLVYTRSSGAAEQVGDGIYLSQVQLEPGNQVTSFEVRPFRTELALCQRYYEKSYDTDTVPGTNTNAGLYLISGSSDVNGNQFVNILFEVPKRYNGYTMTYYVNSGAVGSWSYVRSGTSGNVSMLAAYSGTHSTGSYNANMGAGWVASYIYGHWTCSAEL